MLQQYATLLTDYREMKIAFHDQLVDELKYAGCDLQALLIKGDPQAKPGSDELRSLLTRRLELQKQLATN